MTPPPPVSAPADHFFITDFTYACDDHQCTFWCKTDVPCHLTIHVSADRPIIRRIPYIKRGAEFQLSSLTCFVEIQTIEQTDPGDTIQHTFIIPFPQYDHTYYWYLTATHGGQPSQSISQVFWHKCPLIPPPSYYAAALNPPYDFGAVLNCQFQSTCFQPSITHIMESCDITWTNYHLLHVMPRQGTFQLYTADDDGKPLILLTSANFIIEDLTPAATITQNIPISPTPLTKDLHYAFAYGFHHTPLPQPQGWAWPRYASGLTAEYSIPPLTHRWQQNYKHNPGAGCSYIIKSWFQLTPDRTLQFATYGYTPP